MRNLICALVLMAFVTPLLASDPLLGRGRSTQKTKYTGSCPKNVTLVIEEQGAIFSAATAMRAMVRDLREIYGSVKGGMGTYRRALVFDNGRASDAP